ncbi:receptor-like protein 20 [Eucalyptus grandis]|uniref:receptor-like protein 20 n=1 Tax=Eucalyptus grandis TaxID=71139 RepID=UPI00192E83FB|nr:receptor-like protein 20 [Eucalyptus grandis]
MKVFETNSSSYIGNAIKRAWIFSSDATFDYSMRRSNPRGHRKPTANSIAQPFQQHSLGSSSPFLAKLTNLEALDLSQNQLSGEIPQELTQLNSLSVFNISYNSLTGPILQSQQFATFENNSYEGNLGLCGTPMSRKCRDTKTLSASPTSEEDQDSGSAMELEWKIVCMGYASGLVIGVVLGNCLITRRRVQRLAKNFGRRNKGEEGRRDGPHQGMLNRNPSSSVI